MNKAIRALTVATATAAAGIASAADLPRSSGPYYPPPSISGPNAGVNFGYEWGKIMRSNVEPSGVAGGGQIGYNSQTGQFVFGGETDIQVSGADDTFAPYKFSNPWFGTLHGRVVGGGRHGGQRYAQLVREASVLLCGSGQPRLFDHRVNLIEGTKTGSPGACSEAFAAWSR